MSSSNNNDNFMDHHYTVHALRSSHVSVTMRKKESFISTTFFTPDGDLPQEEKG